MIPKHISVAIGELGTKEILGDEHNPRILEYLKSVGLPGRDEIPWCAAFVNWCLKEAGFNGTGKGLAKSYLSWGMECGPSIGAIAIMNRGVDHTKGHVSFVLQDNGDFVYTIGGNQRDSVTITTVLRKNIISFRRGAW